jgi:hypothetical protein
VKGNLAGTSISQVAYILALIGGILMVIFGLLDIVGASISGFEIIGRPYFFAFGLAGVVTLIMGIIAIIGARSASTLVWAIILIIVGLIGGGLGGLLVLLGGIIGLIAVLTKKA